ncbi:UNVERIFIED_CONTAM: hypothetical protein Scaly_2993300 [Sesamum calycinum]|uniref:Uncharacterized protein n=1 Tax=Sesamum calycinum TaxID=2727403 RepID=A0AAW2KFG9_9LAMI
MFSSLHLYWASVFILPKGVVREIEKRLQEFLWKGSSESRCYKVAWEQVFLPISHGGLGIKRVHIMNQALMAKHLWHLVKKKADSTWVAWIQQNRLKQQTIWSFHGFDGSWGWKKLLKLRNGFLTGVEMKVGNGESFSLWLDPWHPDGPLITRFSVVQGLLVYRLIHGLILLFIKGCGIGLHLGIGISRYYCLTSSHSLWRTRSNFLEEPFGYIFLTRCLYIIFPGFRPTWHVLNEYLLPFTDTKHCT